MQFLDYKDLLRNGEYFLIFYNKFDDLIVYIFFMDFLL